MKVKNQVYKTVWMEGGNVFMADQNLIPFDFKIISSPTCNQTCHHIKIMTVRGAGAIGAVAAFAMVQAINEAPHNTELEYVLAKKVQIEHTRPTARNLFQSTQLVFDAFLKSKDQALKVAQQIWETNQQDALDIGKFGSELISDGMGILTHCNAGWLGFVDYGSALSPIYYAHSQGKKVKVYADETRPRLQGARLTAWELFNQGIEHCIIPDNAAAYFMSKGVIQLVITGADRIAANGDTANKIGTLEKAILAKEFGIPFYIAAPGSTFDTSCLDGSNIEIEFRDPEEVTHFTGPDKDGVLHKIQVSNPGSTALNPGFDVTPCAYITGYITEKGILKAGDIRSYF